MVQQPPQPTRRVFYSWQSDLPNNTNRGFIERALEQAIAAHAKSTMVELAFVDRDTVGVAGSPNIATTIFSKIASSTAFVADISIVNPAPRPTPNPNVLIELGYAFHCLGEERVVMVFNQAHGSLGDVPFDLRQHRIVSYTCDSDDPKSATCSALAANLESQLRAIFALKPRNEQDVRVIVQRGIMGRGSELVPIVTVEVQNHSVAPVYLSSIIFLLDDGQTLFPQRGINGFNSAQKVDAGDSYQLVFYEGEVKEWLAEHAIVAAVARDKIDRRWTSERDAFARLAAQLRKDT